MSSTTASPSFALSRARVASSSRATSRAVRSLRGERGACRGVAPRKSATRGGSCVARVSRYDDVEEITDMMLATSAVGAIGSACSVYALVASLEATSSTAVLVAAGLVESEEVLAMEYSTSRVRAAAVAPPVDIVAEEEERTGQELFECEIQSIRCVI
jgi:hypothetical protein